MEKDKTKVRSWEILSDHVLLKQTDKSVFRYAGATIPRAMYVFFDADDMQYGERRNISVRYNGATYQAKLEKENLHLGRIRIFWDADLKEEFARYMQDRTEMPSLFIIKNDDGTYEFRLR